jgi:hypothetical protein
MLADDEDCECQMSSPHNSERIEITENERNEVNGFDA